MNFCVICGILSISLSWCQVERFLSLQLYGSLRIVVCLKAVINKNSRMSSGNRFVNSFTLRVNHWVIQL